MELDRRARSRLRLRPTRTSRARRRRSAASRSTRSTRPSCKVSVQGRGNPRRAAHRLRPPRHRCRDQAVDAPRATRSQAPARPRRAVRSARELNVEAEGIDIGPSPPTRHLLADMLALPIEDARPHGAVVQLPQARGHPHRRRARLARSEADLLDIRNFGPSRSTRSRPSSSALGCSSRTARPGSTRPTSSTPTAPTTTTTSSRRDRAV